MTEEELLSNPEFVHVISCSGGKDSSGTYCKALEILGPTGFRAVAADTSNEHPFTYRQMELLSEVTGGPKVELVRSDFSERIRAKADYVQAKWPAKLVAGVPGHWEWKAGPGFRDAVRQWMRADRDTAGERPARPEPPRLPEDIYAGHPAVRVEGGHYLWIRGHRPMSEAEADEVVEAALAFLRPTGVAYLDLCIWKGRFPSRKAQFCTFELKISAIDEFVTRPLLAQGKTVISWQGVRASESFERSLLPPIQQLVNHDDLPGELWAYRPLLNVSSVDEVFALAARHGVPRNPLYDYGLKRVGCFPCINASKAELSILDRVFPEQIDRLQAWEQIVSKCSKRGRTTFFNIVNDPVMKAEMERAQYAGEEYEIGPETHGIRRMVEWAKSGRGGRERSIWDDQPQSATCNAWGACE